MHLTFPWWVGRRGFQSSQIVAFDDEVVMQARLVAQSLGSDGAPFVIGDGEMMILDEYAALELQCRHVRFSNQASQKGGNGAQCTVNNALYSLRLIGAKSQIPHTTASDLHFVVVRTFPSIFDRRWCASCSCDNPDTPAPYSCRELSAADGIQGDGSSSDRRPAPVSTTGLTSQAVAIRPSV